MSRQSYDQFLENEFRARIWKALEEVAFDYPDVDDERHKEYMTKGIKHFMTQFYKEEE